MTAPAALILERHQQICSMILNRPAHHNAFDDHLVTAFNEALLAIHHDNTIRVVLLRANGNHFCAGADLQWMQRMATYTASQNQQDALQLARLMQQLSQLNKPTIALVQGSAYGGGVGLVACCDIALASPNATFCFSEVKLGLIPAVISPYVIAAIGERQARRYFMTAEAFAATQALRLNLIHEICDDDLLARGMQLAKLICHNGPHAVIAAKKLIHDVAYQAIDESIINDTAQRIAQLRISPEGQEGINAFLSKRPAKWDQ